MLNRYKNMILLSSKTADDLNEQIKSIGTMIEIVAMYASSNRFYAHIITDRPAKLVKRQKSDVKSKSISELNVELNKE